MGKEAFDSRVKAANTIELDAQLTDASSGQSLDPSLWVNLQYLLMRHSESTLYKAKTAHRPYDTLGQKYYSIINQTYCRLSFPILIIFLQALLFVSIYSIAPLLQPEGQVIDPSIFVDSWTPRWLIGAKLPCKGDYCTKIIIQLVIFIHPCAVGLKFEGDEMKETFCRFQSPS